MSLATRIQQAWNQQASWLVLLRPLSCLYRGVFLTQKMLYSVGVKKAYKAPVPVLVIGNITVGGSGKTPLIIQLVKYLNHRKVKVGVISRGYGGQGPFPKLVSQADAASLVGDEPALIVQETGVAMAVGSNRQEAIELLLAQHDLDLILSDDGLQHFALARDLEWIVLDQQRGLGNQKLLPEGYLREPPSRLNGSTVIEHALNPATSLHMHLKTGKPYRLDGAVGDFDPKRDFHVVVGIGYPERFYTTLAEIGVRVENPHAFADHHDYSFLDLQALQNRPIVTTAKDAVKLKALIQKHPELSTEIWVVPVEAALSEAVYTTLDQQLNSLNITLQ